MSQKSKLLHKLYLEGEFSDVKIHCDEKVFNCHKIILSGQSEVFKKMLSGNNIEATSGKIEITDVSAIPLFLSNFVVTHSTESKHRYSSISGIHKYETGECKYQGIYSPSARYTLVF